MAGISSISPSWVPTLGIVKLNVGLLAATICFSFGLLADLFSSKPLFQTKNGILLVAAPVHPSLLTFCIRLTHTVQLEALITILYWSIHFYDRTLLVDPKVAPQLPLLEDLGFHFFPTFFLLLDTLFFSPPWQTHALGALGWFALFAAGYWMWIEHCFSYNRFYPYPLMGMLNPVQRAGLFGFATLLCWSAFLTVRELYRRVNGEIMAAIQHQKEKQKKAN
jgi:FAR-17a/AIG1-like protein